eukprot:PhM_4_TR11563/c0_g1_i1/m.85595
MSRTSNTITVEPHTRSSASSIPGFMNGTSEEPTPTNISVLSQPLPLWIRLMSVGVRDGDSPDVCLELRTFVLDTLALFLIACVVILPSAVDAPMTVLLFVAFSAATAGAVYSSRQPANSRNAQLVHTFLVAGAAAAFFGMHNGFNSMYSVGLYFGGVIRLARSRVSIAEIVCFVLCLLVMVLISALDVQIEHDDSTTLSTILNTAVCGIFLVWMVLKSRLMLRAAWECENQHSRRQSTSPLPLMQRTELSLPLSPPQSEAEDAVDNILMECINLLSGQRGSQSSIEPDSPTSSRANNALIIAHLNKVMRLRSATSDTPTTFRAISEASFVSEERNLMMSLTEMSDTRSTSLQETPLLPPSRDFDDFNTFFKTQKVLLQEADVSYSIVTRGRQRFAALQRSRDATVHLMITHPNIIAPACEFESNFDCITVWGQDDPTLRHIIAKRRRGGSPSATPAGDSASEGRTSPSNAEAPRYIEQSKLCVWLVQILSALHHLHSIGQHHGTLTLWNIYVASHNHVRIGDREVGRLLWNHAEGGDGCEYSAPESDSNTPAGDVWAVGYLLHALCNLRLPFEGMSHANAEDAIRRGAFPALPADRFDSSFRDTVTSMLSPDPHDRPAVGDVLKRSFCVSAVSRLPKVGEMPEVKSWLVETMNRLGITGKDGRRKHRSRKSKGEKSKSSVGGVDGGDGAKDTGNVQED